MAIDFSSYGLNWSFNPTIGSFVPGDYHSLIENVNVTKTAAGYTELISGRETYILGNYVGGGTFGKVYDAIRQSDGKAMVVKEITGTTLYNTIKETIINILIVEKTKNLNFPDVGLKGPFAPTIYGVAYNKSRGSCYIFSEKLRATVHSALFSYAGHPAFRDVFCVFVSQAARIMKTLGDVLNFNHRDFKTDNCMYIRDSAGAINVRLIDFGFSCITYEGIFLDGGGYHFKHCKLPSRDMAQFLYELYKFKKHILGDDIKTLIETLLTFQLPTGKLCKMTNGCPRMKEWKQTYTFLNTKDFVIPNATPEVVGRVMNRFTAGAPYQTELAFDPATKAVLPSAIPAVPIVCPAGKVFNPTTGRCVGVSGPIGRKLVAAALGGPGVAALAMKPCPADRPERNPKTRRCMKVCPPDKKRNTATFKCVRDNTGPCPAGRPERNPSTFRCVKDKSVAAVAACPPGRPDHNPKTGKCVVACKLGTRRNPTTFRCIKEKVIKPCPSERPDRDPKTGRCKKACPPGKKRNAITFKCVK